MSAFLNHHDVYSIQGTDNEINDTNSTKKSKIINRQTNKEHYGHFCYFKCNNVSKHNTWVGVSSMLLAKATIHTSSLFSIPRRLIRI